MQEENSQLLTFGARLEKLIRDKVGDRKTFALRVGLSESALSYYCRGRRSPGADELQRMSSELGVEMGWLWNGIQSSENPKHSSAGPSEIKGDSGIPKNWGGPYWGTTNMAPIIAFARGGFGAYPEDQGNDGPHIPVTCKDSNCYVVTLEGDSMEPIYSAGDLLVCMPSYEAQPGDLVVVKMMDDETLFKKWRPHGKLIRLLSFNPKYPAYEDFDRSAIRKMHPVQSVIRILKGKIL